MRSKLFVSIFGLFFGMAQLSNASPVVSSVSDCCKKAAACCDIPSSPCCTAKGDKPSDKKAEKKSNHKSSTTETPVKSTKRSGSVFGKRYSC